MMPMLVLGPVFVTIITIALYVYWAVVAAYIASIDANNSGLQQQITNATTQLSASAGSASQIVSSGLNNTILAGAAVEAAAASTAAAAAVASSMPSSTLVEFFFVYHLFGFLWTVQVWQ